MNHFYTNSRMRPNIIVLMSYSSLAYAIGLYKSLSRKSPTKIIVFNNVNLFKFLGILGKFNVSLINYTFNKKDFLLTWLKKFRVARVFENSDVYLFNRAECLEQIDVIVSAHGVRLYFRNFDTFKIVPENRSMRRLKLLIMKYLIRVKFIIARVNSSTIPVIVDKRVVGNLITQFVQVEPITKLQTNSKVVILEDYYHYRNSSDKLGYSIKAERILEYFHSRSITISIKPHPMFNTINYRTGNTDVIDPCIPSEYLLGRNVQFLIAIDSLGLLSCPKWVTPVSTLLIFKPKGFEERVEDLKARNARIIFLESLSKDVLDLVFRFYDTTRSAFKVSGENNES